MHFCLALCLAFGCMFASRVVAATESVVLLEAAGPTAWPNGRSRIAVELELAGFVVVERPSDAKRHPDDIIKQLQTELRASGALGAVATSRVGNVGEAYVATRVAGAVRVQRVSTRSASDPAELTIIALRVVELLNMSTLTLELPTPVEVGDPLSEERASALSWLGWVSVGPAFSSDAHAGVVGHLGFLHRLGDRWHLELSGYGGIVPHRVSVIAGDARIRVAAIQFHFGWTPNPGHAWQVDLALGGGGLLARSEASAVEGFDGAKDNTTASVLSLRIRARYALDRRLSLLVGAEPGVIIPTLSVRAAGVELARLGRPWIPLSVGVGWSF